MSDTKIFVICFLLDCAICGWVVLKAIQLYRAKVKMRDEDDYR